MSPPIERTTCNGTPFHPRTALLNQTTWWYGWNGYVIPDVYTDPRDELAAVREGVAVIDMSPLPKYEISGPDAPRLIDRLITRDATRLSVNQIYYTPLCNEEGKVVADGLVFRLDETTYRLSMDNCTQWFTQQARGLDVQIEDTTATLKKMIGFGCLEKESAGVGAGLSVEWPVDGEWRQVKATVVGLPFLELRRG